MLVNVYGMEVPEYEADYWRTYIRQNIKDELHEAIGQEIGKGIPYKTHILWQDDIMISGIFKACNGKEGSFSLLKLITPCPVVNVY